MSKHVTNLKNFHPEIVVLHPEGLVIHPSQLKAVCSECREPLRPNDFGNGVFHWTCGCQQIISPLPNP